MSKRLTFIACLCAALYVCAPAQTIKPSIGLAALPADTDSICTIPWYLGSFAASGLQAGDTVADFTLYDTSGVPFTLSSALALKKPVLLISASLTCPVFRNKIPSINNVLSTYGSQVTTAVIYCVEAHPTDTSPYFGYVNITSANMNAGILYPQPTTYGQRKQMVKDMYAKTTLAAPTYIDGPCNNWWLYYGPAPNNAYLIDTNGIVAAKHPWYDAYPDDIFCDIDSVLGITGNCSTTTSGGNFVLQMITPDTMYGSPGSTVTIEADLINNDTANSVLIKLARLQTQMAPGWASSLCATVCYSTSTDSVTISVPAGATQKFHFYFYTDTVPNMSAARIGFRNENNASNKYVKDFYAYTTATSVKELPGVAQKLALRPVPAGNELHIDCEVPLSTIGIYDVSGKRMLASSGVNTLDVSALPAGYYIVKALDEKGALRLGKFIKANP